MGQDAGREAHLSFVGVVSDEISVAQRQNSKVTFTNQSPFDKSHVYARVLPVVITLVDKGQFPFLIYMSILDVESGMERFRSAVNRAHAILEARFCVCTHYAYPIFHHPSTPADNRCTYVRIEH